MTLGSAIRTVASLTTAVFSVGIYDQVRRLVPSAQQSPDFVDRVRQGVSAAATAAADHTKK